MNNVTVTCGCGRRMVPHGHAERGTFRCGCGSEVAISVRDDPECAAIADTAERCRFIPVRESAAIGLTLCAEHLAKFAEMVESLRIDDAAIDAQRREEAVAAREGHATEFRDTLLKLWSEDAHERRRRIPRGSVGDWYVYYIRMGNLIKIGTTGDYWQRMSNLLPDELLAFEPGALPLENQRHGEFARWRVIGERFAQAPDLLRHIADLQERHGGHYPPDPDGKCKPQWRK